MSIYKRIALVVSVVVVWAMMPLGPFVMGWAGDVESLRGLKEVVVEIKEGGLAPEIAGRGLTIDTVRTDVELKLRLAGLKVLEAMAILRVDGQPYLPVTLLVNLVVGKREKKESFLYCTRVQLVELVSLERKPESTEFAITWESDQRLGIVSDLKHVRNAVKDAVDEFINVYLAANPIIKSGSKKQK